jgi:hypothetical protein
MRRILFAAVIAAASLSGIHGASAEERCQISVQCVEDMLDTFVATNCNGGGVNYCSSSDCSGSVNVCGGSSCDGGGVNVCGNASTCTGLVNLCR